MDETRAGRGGSGAVRCSQRWGEPRRWAWGLLSNPWSRAVPSCSLRPHPNGTRRDAAAACLRVTSTLRLPSPPGGRRGAQNPVWLCLLPAPSSTRAPSPPCLPAAPRRACTPPALHPRPQLRFPSLRVISFLVFWPRSGKPSPVLLSPGVRWPAVERGWLLGAAPGAGVAHALPAWARAPAAHPRGRLCRCSRAAPTLLGFVHFGLAGGIQEGDASPSPLLPRGGMLQLLAPALPLHASPAIPAPLLLVWCWGRGAQSTALMGGSQGRELQALPEEMQTHPRALGVGESSVDAEGKGVFVRLVMEEENPKHFPGVLGAGKNLE